MSRDATLTRAVAIDYALRYADEGNDEFWQFDNDCTNFVSQCWNKGGIPETAGWYWQNHLDYSHSWTVVDDFADYMVNISRNYTSDRISVAVFKDLSEAQPGDIIQFKNYDDVWHHSAIITNISNGEIYYAQHTENAKNKELSKVYPSKEKEVRIISPISAV